MRAFIIGNGSLLAAGGAGGCVNALFAPDLAPEHQRLRRPARLGIWVDGSAHWLPGPFQSGPHSDRASIIAEQSLRSDALGLEVWIESFVTIDPSLTVRRVEVANRTNRPREARLLLHHDFRLSPAGTTEIARRDEHTGGLVHQAGAAWALVNLIGPAGVGVRFARFTPRASPDAAGAERFAACAPEAAPRRATGLVDSLAWVPLELSAGGSAVVTTWIATGRSLSAVRAADESFRREGVGAALGRARAHWNLWLAEGRRDFVHLPEDVITLFDQALLTLRQHQAPGGAILSELSRATAERDRRACLLVDAAVAADALGRAGHGAAARRYFSFVSRSVSEWGEPVACLDVTGAPAATREGIEGLGVHLWALARHYERDRDVEFLESQMSGVVGPFADRLVESLDLTLRLPVCAENEPGEDVFRIASAAAVRGGLRAAARLAALLGQESSARGWLAAADEIAATVARHLYRSDLGRFVRAIVRGDSGLRPDPALDASLLEVGLFDDFEPEDPRVRSTVDSVRAALWVRSGAGGLAESAEEGDGLGGLGDGPRTAWAPATLLLACQRIRTAGRVQDLDDARTLFLWCAARAEGRGWLPERIPDDGADRAPSLLTHAWLVTALLDYAQSSRLLRRCERCGAPPPARREKRVTQGGRSFPGLVTHP